MAKGKPSPKITKGAKGRKNHGPKRHLHHSISPKALRMQIAGTGVLSKYNDYDSFCLAMQARGVRSNTQIMWAEFCRLGKKDQNGGWVEDRAAQKAFFADAKNIAARLMSTDKKSKKGVKAS